MAASVDRSRVAANEIGGRLGQAEGLVEPGGIEQKKSMVERSSRVNAEPRWSAPENP
jgi:hypothetical protein